VWGNDMEDRDSSIMPRRLALAICAAGFFWIFAIHVLTGFLDFMTKDGVGSRSGMVGSIDAAINSVLVVPLGGSLAAATLFVAGIGVAWLVGRARGQDAGNKVRLHETAPIAAPPPNNGDLGKRRIAPARPAPASNISPEKRTECPQAWLSGVLGNYEIGDKPGLRTKFYGEDWPPARHELGAASDERLAILRKYCRGYALAREEMPEAVAVFDEKCFRRMGDIFWAGGIFVVRGRLAELLSHFDLGDGGLVSLPVYKADLVTPYEGDFFILNFGARKSSFLPEQSRNVAKFSVVKATGLQTWQVYDWRDDGDVALLPTALNGPELWFEEVVYNQIFVKDTLAQALIEIGMGDIFKLKPCRIVDDVE
jgi:hypothetical protein